MLKNILIVILALLIPVLVAAVATGFFILIGKVRKKIFSKSVKFTIFISLSVLFALVFYSMIYSTGLKRAQYECLNDPETPNQCWNTRTYECEEGLRDEYGFCGSPYQN